MNLPLCWANVAHRRATSVSEWSPHSLTLVALTKPAPILVATLLTTITMNAADQSVFNAKGGKIGL